MPAALLFFTMYPYLFTESSMSQELPKHWSNMKPDENLKLVDLKSTDSEYKTVLADFMKTLGRTPQIITVLESLICSMKQAEKHTEKKHAYVLLCDFSYLNMFF